MSGFGAFWATWAAVGLLAEALALGRRRTGDTLSENLRAVVTKPVLRKASLVGWVGFSTWFAFHIWG